MLSASAAGSARPPSAAHFRRPSLPSRRRRLLPPPARCPPAKPHSFAPENPRKLEIRPPPRSAAAEAVALDGAFDEFPDAAVDEANKGPQTAAKPRPVLKFVWMEKNIGLGLDQMIPGHGAVPLGPYCFWPRKDAWEELKALLESKPWISQERMIILLNQATDIINLWQRSGAGSLQQ